MQVKEQIDLFMDALYEAIALVVVVSLIGFWEWRSAVLMAISIPITLAMTFGIIYVLGIDVQQVSRWRRSSSRLGLLVDGSGGSRAIPSSACWPRGSRESSRLGWARQRLPLQSCMRTITNIVAYLPFLMVTGTTGEFIYSLPVVMTAALVSSRLASMTFIPLLGYYLLRPGKKPEAPIEERRTTGFTGFYAGVAKFAIEHRWKVTIGSLAFLVLGGFLFTQLKTSFFPDDVQYWSYVDVWLPNDANFDATNQAAQGVEQIIREQAEEWGKQHPDKDGNPSQVLKYVTTWVGGGSPRFWFSVSPAGSRSSSTMRRCCCVRPART